MSIGFNRSKVEYGQTLCAFSAGGSSTTSVAFSVPFVEPPAVLVVPNLADTISGATWSATSISKTGFTISVSGSNFQTQDRMVTWVAHEKD